MHKILAQMNLWSEELTKIRRSIHQHPELGFETKETAQRIVNLLKEWGVKEIDDQSIPGGVIAVIQGEKQGKTIAIRADIDALPMDDMSSHPWKSQHQGRAHACGHDGHQTWVLGALRYLQANNDFAGRIVGIFQPAEEIAKGAKCIVNSGILEKYDIKEIYAGHTEPLLPKGVIGFKVGALQASADSFWITFEGKGTHGGRPHLGIDPIPVGAQFVQAAQTIVSRQTDPMDTAVVSICSINAGRFETPNVVPHQLTMSGTVRTFKPETRDRIEKDLEALAQHVAAGSGCTLKFEYLRQCSAVINSKEQTLAAVEATKTLLGNGSVEPNMNAFMSSEDFSEYLAKIPGAIMRVGIRDDAHIVSLHHQAFDFNDEVLPKASATLVNIVLNRLERLAQ